MINEAFNDFDRSKRTHKRRTILISYDDACESEFQLNKKPQKLFYDIKMRDIFNIMLIKFNSLFSS